MGRFKKNYSHAIIDFPIWAQSSLRQKCILTIIMDICDNNGIFVADPKIIKGYMFPDLDMSMFHDPLGYCTDEHIKKDILFLEEKEFIKLIEYRWVWGYDAKVFTYGFIKEWDKVLKYIGVQYNMDKKSNFPLPLDHPFFHSDKIVSEDEVLHDYLDNFDLIQAEMEKA